MKINEWIRAARKQAGLTQEKLGYAIGRTKGNISSWEKDLHSPSLQQIVAISEITGVPLPNELLPKKTESNASIAGEMEEWDNNIPLHEDDVEVPFFKEVELAAGIGREVIEDNNGFKLRFAKSTLKKAGVTPCNAKCVVVSGNSMEPALRDGSTVGVDIGCTTIKDGTVYAIDHDGALRVKQLYKLPNGGLRIRSFNREEWDDENLTPEQAQHVRVIGKVFWSSTLW